MWVVVWSAGWLAEWLVNWLVVLFVVLLVGWMVRYVSVGAVYFVTLARSPAPLFVFPFCLCGLVVVVVVFDLFVHPARISDGFVFTSNFYWVLFGRTRKRKCVGWTWRFPISTKTWMPFRWVYGQHCGCLRNVFVC